MILRVIDIETTGLAPPAEIIELGRVDVVSSDGSYQINRPAFHLFRPLHGIPPETKAIHHITDNDFLADTPICSNELLQKAIWEGSAPDVLVAHNCGFERTFIPEAASSKLPWICTLKVALHVWPAAPGHSNQILRYWRNLDLDNALATPPHRAAPDAWVTAHLLVELLTLTTVDQMISWTEQPKKLPTIPFGKHRGSTWSDVPQGYLQWMVRQADMDADVILCAGEELERRQC